MIVGQNKFRRKNEVRKSPPLPKIGVAVLAPRKKCLLEESILSRNSSNAGLSNKVHTEVVLATVLTVLFLSGNVEFSYTANSSCSSHALKYCYLIGCLPIPAVAVTQWIFSTFVLIIILLWRASHVKWEFLQLYIINRDLRERSLILRVLRVIALCT